MTNMHIGTGFMMDVISALLRLALAAVFALAAVAKALQSGAFKESVVAFGLRSPRIAAALAVVVPLLEVAVAGALLWAPWAWWGAAGAAMILAAFTVAIVANLLQGRRPSCNCFGQLRRKPIGVPTILRNVVLLGMAGYLTLAGREHPAIGLLALLARGSVGAWVICGAVLAGIAAISTQGWLIAELLRQQGRLLLRIDALEMRLGNLGMVAGPDVHKRMSGWVPGTIAPAFEAETLAGVATSLVELKRAAKPILLLFSDAQCAPCNALMPQLARWFKELSSHVSIVLITRGTHAEVRAKLVDGLERQPESIVVQKDREIAALYRADATPSAVLINTLGLIDSHLAVGANEIAELLWQSAPQRGSGGEDGAGKAARSPRAVAEEGSMLVAQTMRS